MVHSTLAFTPEGVPLGLLAPQVWARDPDDIGKRHRRKQRPIIIMDIKECNQNLGPFTRCQQL